MTRQARLLAALLGLWGGAFAWTQSTRPERRRVERLTHTGEPRDVATAPFAWPDRPPVRDEDRAVRRDLFAVAAPAGTTTMAPTPRPAAIAPALRYVGFVADGGGRRVFLSGSNGVVAVAEGDVLAGGWRIERIDAERVSLRNVVEDAQVDIGREP